MMKLTVICRDEGYPDIYIYTIEVRDPDDKAEVQGAINMEREHDLGEPCDTEILFAFQGDLQPRADWRE